MGTVPPETWRKRRIEAVRFVATSVRPWAPAARMVRQTISSAPGRLPFSSIATRWRGKAS